jgi:hypothetical protein
MSVYANLFYNRTKIRRISHEGLCVYTTFSIFFLYKRDSVLCEVRPKMKELTDTKRSGMTYREYYKKYETSHFEICRLWSAVYLWLKCGEAVYTSMLRKSMLKNILNSRIFGVFPQCSVGCKFFGQKEKESPEAVGSADIYSLLLSLPYFYSLTVVTVGMATFNCFSLLTLYMYY